MEILLDANFVISCVKQKIDFFSLADELFDEKIEFIICEEILDELENISRKRGEKIRDKEAAKTALEIIKTIKPEIIKLNNKNVDEGIICYLTNHKELVLATLDRELKRKIRGEGIKILTIRGKKSLEII